MTFPRPPAAPRSSTSASVCRLWRLLLLEDACPHRWRTFRWVAAWPFGHFCPSTPMSPSAAPHWHTGSPLTCFLTRNKLMHTSSSRACIPEHPSYHGDALKLRGARPSLWCVLRETRTVHPSCGPFITPLPQHARCCAPWARVRMPSACWPVAERMVCCTPSSSSWSPSQTWGSTSRRRCG